MRAIAPRKLAVVLSLILTAPALAQHHPDAAVAVPFTQTSHSFFEQIGLNFGVHGHNFFFQENGFGGAAPQFGGANSGAGLNTGLSFQLPGDVQANVNLVASQGSQTTLAGTAVSTTIPNGGGGMIFDSSQTPFVTSVVPVVGDQAGVRGPASPVQERVERLREAGSASYGIRPGSPAAQAATKNASKSAAAKAPAASSAPPSSSAPVSDAPSPAAASATSGGPPLTSVAELREQRAAVASAELQAAEALAEKAKEAEAAGKLGVARIYYQQAAHRAGDSPRKAQWAARAAALAPPTRSGR